MTLKTNDIEPAIASVKKALADEPNLSPALAGALETLLLLVSLLLSRLGLDSQNSSTRRVVLVLRLVAIGSFSLSY